jgi:hypothetical protein
VATILSALALTGCPMEFGKGGFNDRAVHNDTRDNMFELRACSAAYKDKVCGDGPDKDDAECERCGGR